MNIYEAIKADHDEYRRLLNALAETSGDSLKRRSLWTKFHYDVKAHAAAEEESLCAELIATVDGQPEARHSVHEHQQLDDIMEELNEMDMSSGGWLTRFKTLHHDYDHHIEEEENEIFTKAKDAIGGDKTGALANKFASKKKNELKLVDKKQRKRWRINYPQPTNSVAGQSALRKSGARRRTGSSSDQSPSGGL